MENQETVTGQHVEMVWVPRHPTPEMVYAAADEAHAENAEGVWKYMIAEHERALKKRKS